MNCLLTGLPHILNEIISTFPLLAKLDIYFRSDLEGERPKTMVIGSNNVFEVGCIVEARYIGDNNVFESKCE